MTKLADLYHALISLTSVKRKDLHHDWTYPHEIELNLELEELKNSTIFFDILSIFPDVINGTCPRLSITELESDLLQCRENNSSVDILESSFP